MDSDRNFKKEANTSQRGPQKFCAISGLEPRTSEGSAADLSPKPPTIKNSFSANWTNFRDTWLCSRAIRFSCRRYMGCSFYLLRPLSPTFLSLMSPYRGLKTSFWRSFQTLCFFSRSFLLCVLRTCLLRVSGKQKNNSFSFVFLNYFVLMFLSSSRLNFELFS